MRTRKPFLLRTDQALLAALHRWAADELRSVNAQIDFLLRQGLRDANRLPAPGTSTDSSVPKRLKRCRRSSQMGEMNAELTASGAGKRGYARYRRGVIAPASGSSVSPSSKPFAFQSFRPQNCAVS